MNNSRRARADGANAFAAEDTLAVRCRENITATRLRRLPKMNQNWLPCSNIRRDHSGMRIHATFW